MFICSELVPAHFKGIFAAEAFEGFEILFGKLQRIALFFGIGERGIIGFIGESADRIGDFALFKEQLFDLELERIGSIAADGIGDLIHEVALHFALADTLRAGIAAASVEVFFALLPKASLHACLCLFCKHFERTFHSVRILPVST